jgi:hypothetical protein
LFSTYPVFEERMIFVTSGGSELSDKDILLNREILLPDGQDRWNSVFLNFFRNSNLTPRIRYVKGAAALFLNLSDGNAAAFLPQTIFETLDLSSLTSRDLRIPDSYIKYMLIWNKMNLNPALQLIINEFGDMAANGERAIPDRGPCSAAS